MENIENPNQSIREKYLSKADNEGYISLSDARAEFDGRQIKNIASLLDGEEGTEPDYNLGGGLNFKGKSGNYSDMKIHIDSLEEFIERVKNHYK